MATKSRDWLGFTSGHVRAMLLAVVIQGGFAFIGAGILAGEFSQMGPLKNQSASTLTGLGVSVIVNPVILVCCGLAFWGVPRRKMIGKVAILVLMLVQAIWMLSLAVFMASQGVLGEIIAVISCLPQIIMLFYLIRGFMSVDLRQHYRSRY